MTRTSHDASSATAGPATKTRSKRSLAALDPGHGYPHGHLGHLTPDEEAALASFKTYLTDKGLYTPGGAPPLPPPSHHDAVLLRFLRARRWVVADAYRQFRDTEAWRAAVHIDVLYDTIDVDAYEQSRRLYPQWTGRRDRRGIPVYVFEIRHLDSKTIAAYEKSIAKTSQSRAGAPPPPKEKQQQQQQQQQQQGAHHHDGGPGDGTTTPKLVRLFALYENLTRFAQPLCTQLTDREHPRTPITLSTNIVDVSGVSLKQFWNLKGHMQAASQLATAHYPETLDRIFIIGAPVFFSTVWGWVKRWFDPVTVSKIFILSHSEVLPTLSSFIDTENIPTQYGGKLDFKWCEMPNLDPKIRELATWENGYTEFPKGPVYWVPVDGGKRMACLARGSVDMKERNERVCTIPVAFPEQEAAAPAANGNAVEPAAAPGGRLEEAPADVPTAGEATKTDAKAVPVVTNGIKEAALPEVTSPTGDKSANAPEEVPASPSADITEGEAVQNLSLRDAGEKTGPGDAAVSEKTGETATIPNGKPVVAP